MAKLTFLDLERLDDPSTQVVLHGVSYEQLAIALAPTSDSFKQRIYQNMSARATKILQDDMEERSPVPESDSAANQLEIEAIMEGFQDADELRFGAI
jgi:flagellar motor switch protein FliG